MVTELRQIGHGEVNKQEQAFSRLRESWHGEGNHVKFTKKNCERAQHAKILPF